MAMAINCATNKATRNAGPKPSANATGITKVGRGHEKRLAREIKELLSRNIACELDWGFTTRDFVKLGIRALLARRGKANAVPARTAISVRKIKALGKSRMSG